MCCQLIKYFFKKKSPFFCGEITISTYFCNCDLTCYSCPKKKNNWCLMVKDFSIINIKIANIFRYLQFLFNVWLRIWILPDLYEYAGFIWVCRIRKNHGFGSWIRSSFWKLNIKNKNFFSIPPLSGIQFISKILKIYTF